MDIILSKGGAGDDRRLPDATEPEAVYRYARQHGLDDMLIKLREQTLAVADTLRVQLDPGDYAVVSARYVGQGGIAFNHAPDSLAGAYLAVVLLYTAEALLYYGATDNHITAENSKGIIKVNAIRRARSWKTGGEPVYKKTAQYIERLAYLTRSATWQECQSRCRAIDRVNEHSRSDVH